MLKISRDILLAEIEQELGEFKCTEDNWWLYNKLEAIYNHIKDNKDWWMVGIELKLIVDTD